MDELLKAAMRERQGEGPGPHLDAERLAAWADAALSADEAAGVEAHLADCAQCQALMAEFARTDEGAAAQPAVVVPIQSKRAIRWWMPAAAGTLAATLLIAVLVRDRTTPQPESTVSQSLPSSADVAAGLPAVPAPPATESEAPRATVPPASTLESKAADSRQATATNEAAAPSQPAKSQTAGGLVGGVTGGIRGGAAGAAATVPPPPTVAARTDALEVAAAAPIAIDEATIAFEFVSPTAATPAAEPVAGASAGRGGGRSGGAARAAPVQLKAAEPPVRWRILASGAVVQSKDAGQTWVRVVLDAAWPAVSTGSAPSASVCWLAGHAGLVLLSTDGTRFERVSAPADTDLASIRATSEQQATVTTTDGRTFTTADGGRTWTPGR